MPTAATTYATNDQVINRCVVAQSALQSISDFRTGLTTPLASVDMDDFRVEAKRQILIRLRDKGILEMMITRPADLQEAEVMLTICLVCEAASVIPGNDVYARLAADWRPKFAAEMARVAPIDLVKGTGSTFTWDRG